MVKPRLAPPVWMAPMGVSLALAALAFLGWRTLRPQGNPLARGGRAEVAPSSAPPVAVPPKTYSAPGEPEAAEAPPVVRDSLGVLVFGSVLDGTGARVAAGTLSFTTAEGEEREGRIDVPGSYTALGLRSGRWKLGVRAEGFYPFETDLEIPAGIERQRFDVSLERAVVLRVRFVTPDGALLADASEAVQRDDDLRPVAIATTEPPPPSLPDVSGRSASLYGVGRWNGRARWNRDDSIPEGFDGLLVLDQPPPLYVSAALRDVVLDTQRVVAGVDTVEFTLAPEELDARLCGLRLSVVDAVTGAPIAEGRVDLSHSQRGGGGRPLGVDGTLEFSGQPPGLMELDTWAEGYERIKKRVRLLPGETIDFTLALAPDVALEGRVIGPDGAGLSVGMSTIPLHQVSMPLDVDTRSQFKSDSEGRFETQVGQNEAMIVVTERELAITPLWVDARATLPELVLRVGPGTPVRLRADSAAPALVRAVLADAAGRPFYTTRVRGERELRLQPGAYRLRVGSDEQSWSDAPFTVGTEPMTVTFPDSPR